MKAFQLVGVRKSGKTTTVEALVREFKRRGYIVGTIKSINCPTFSLDTKPGSNTRRHLEAGADVVVAMGKRETDYIYPEAQTPDAIFSKLEDDGVQICIVEGGYNIRLPRIVCLQNEEELCPRITDETFLVSGVISGRTKEIKGFRVLDANTDASIMADIILENTPELILPVGSVPVPDDFRKYCQHCNKADCLADRVKPGSKQRSVSYGTQTIGAV